MCRSTRLVLCLGLLLSALVIFSHQSLAVEAEHWPPVKVPETATKLLALREQQRAEQPVSFENYMKDHAPFGDYLNYGVGRCDKTTETSRLDANGIIQKKMGEEFYYHPVASAQCGLIAYGHYLRGKEGIKQAALYADNLIDLQNEKGAFGYPFPYKYYITGEILKPGWTSGMAQGQAMSLFARVYATTGDIRYVEHGKRALDYLGTPVEQGGVATTLRDLDPSLQKYVFFEEYVTTPANYTLNGFMFALLGLYDWANLPSHVDANQAYARTLFYSGIQTLERILPYYDMGRLTAYDLGYITHKAKTPNISNSYHGVHIYLLHALRSIVGSEVLHSYERKWTSYLNQR